MLGKDESALRVLDVQSERSNSKLSLTHSAVKLQASPGSFITQEDDGKSAANMSMSRGSLHSGRPESHLPVTKIATIQEVEQASDQYSEDPEQVSPAKPDSPVKNSAPILPNQMGLPESN